MKRSHEQAKNFPAFIIQPS